jgi:cobalt-zinc-cadmium efflux system protein
VHKNSAEGYTTAQRLRFAILAVSLVLILEIIGGLLTHSLALLADAAHVFMDVFALGLSLGAVALARLPATETRTYGWHRSEIFAALLNSLALLLVSLLILREAYHRLVLPQQVLAGPMVVVAAIGLGANALVAWRMHDPHGHDLNLRSAYFHVLGDLGASIAVVAGGLIIWLTNWRIVDPLLSIGIGLVIVVAAIRLLLETTHILLEGVPREINLNEVAEAIQSLPGVNGVHDLHIWTVCSHIYSLSCHVEVLPEQRPEADRLVADINALLKDKFRITHSTIQVDCPACADERVTQDLAH